MGNCTTVKDKSKKILPLHLRTPQDLQLYNPKINHSLEKHSFECELYNLKLVGSTEKQVKILFNIPGMIQLLFPKKSAETSSQEIQWKNRGKFNIRGNDYQIRTSFIQIELFNGQNTKIGHLQINSYQIMNGPSHNDFRISLKNKKQARLIFELKISQVIEVQIESIKTEVQFNKQYPNEKFYYTIRAMVNPSAKRPISEMDLNSTSFPSYTQDVPYMSSYDLQTINDSPDNLLNLRLKKKHSTYRAIEKNSKLTWSKSQCSQMPAFKIRMLSSELLHSQFKMNIWKVTELNKEQSIQNFGQMTIFLNPLMQEQPIERQVNNKKILERNASFTGEIVDTHNVQKKIGKCTIQFKIKNSQFFTQKIGCTMTEDGIMNMSHNEIYSSSTTITNNNFKEICKKFDQFMQKYLDLNSNQGKGKHWNAYSNMKKSLKQLATLLHQNHKKSQVYFSQSEIAQLEQRQTTLLRIASQIKQVIESDSSIADLCWRIQVFIFRRGELLLKNLGFRPNQKQKLKNNGIDNGINSKMLICLQYQQIIYSLLQLSLSSSHRMKSYASLDDDYSEIFKAYCYLSVPLFREKLLKIITKKPKKTRNQDQYNKQNDQKELLDLKMTRNKQQLKASAIRENIMATFDFQENLYKWIRRNPRSLQQNSDLLEKMDQYESALTNMIQITPEFFSFIKTFMKELQRNQDLKNLPFWQYIPGYNKIVEKIHAEMIKASLENYFGDEGVGEVSMCLLTNPNLFQPFLHIIFEKTNIFNQSSVMQMLSIVNQYLRFMIKMDKLTSNFPYQYLMKGLKLLLQGDSVAVITKTLVFLYNIFDHIGTEFKQSLIMYFLGKVFNSFFYHWAYNVRNTFHHLFIEKFSQCQQLIALPQIKSRYQTILSMISNAQEVQVRENLKSKTKYKHIHEAMREKLHKMKRVSLNTKNKRPRRLSDELALEKLQCNIIGRNIQISTLKDVIKQQQQQQEMVVVKLKKKMTYFETNKITDITNKPKQISQEQPVIHKSEQYELKELLENQVPYIIEATKQFHEINKNLRTYMEKEKKLPTITLDFEISLDQKDIKPNLTM